MSSTGVLTRNQRVAASAADAENKDEIIQELRDRVAELSYEIEMAQEDMASYEQLEKTANLLAFIFIVFIVYIGVIIWMSIYNNSPLNR